jgi:hypothetical protein
MAEWVDPYTLRLDNGIVHRMQRPEQRSHATPVINEIIQGQGQHHLNNMSDAEIHALMARLEEEAYHRLGVLVGKIDE